MKKGIWLLLLFIAVTRIQAQTVVSFRFSHDEPSSSEVIAGWIPVFGDPSLAVRTGSDPTTGISVSSVNAANWFVNGDVGAADGIGVQNSSYFPWPVLGSGWLQQGGVQAQFNAAVPQLEISGLNPDSQYYIKMSASYLYGTDGDPTQYTVSGSTMLPSQYLIIGGNLTSGITFQHVSPDANGKVRVYVNTTSTTDFAMISGLQIISGSAQVAMPAVHITSPANNDILAEESNIVINATATETGGTISKVEFFANDVKIGESTTAPYSLTWMNPDAGHYLITVKATDGTGTTNTATINLSVESLTSFWSMTGNIHMNADSNFIGNVDSVRLAFRTKNIERMSISPLGNVGIGTINPTAQLHTTGTVRLAGLKNDSTNSQPRILVSDTSGNLFYRSMSSVGGLTQPGFQYYPKQSYLQIGASDHIDTSQSAIVYGNFPSSGLIINSDDPNTFKGKIMNTVFIANNSTIDTNTYTENDFISGERFHLIGPSTSIVRSNISGYHTDISANILDCMIHGQGMTISKPTIGDHISGVDNETQDTSMVSLIGGARIQFGGLGQFASGAFLVNRSPFGATLGNGNVDFTSLPYTGVQGTAVANIGNYPLFALGNSTRNGNFTVGSAYVMQSNAFTVLYNGRTQINTTGMTNTLAQTDVTPKAALDVVSTNTGVLLPRLTNAQRNAIAAGDLQNGLLLYNTDSSAFQYYNGSAWNSFAAGAAGAGSSRWRVSGSGAVFDSLDNIGIGTSNTQGYKLAVNGNAIFTKIKVKAVGNWPDYVFSPEYHLPTLPELERYIAANKHLPELPSADEVSKEGQDVGANQQALLKKVEELTLYVIDLNKKVEALEKENQRLKTSHIDHQGHKLKQSK